MTAVVIASIVILSTAALAEEEKRYSSINEHPQDVYFGDPHIHTRISTDAAMWGTTMGPEETYRYVLAEEMGARWHQMLKDGNLRQVTDEVIKAYGDGVLPWDVDDPKLIAPGWKQVVWIGDRTCTMNRRTS